MNQSKLNSKKPIPRFNEAFFLKPIQNIYNYQFQSIVIPLFKQTKLNKNKSTGQSLCIPKWNNDGLCYTPSFIIPQDHLIFQKIKNTLKEGYLQQIQRNQQESTNIPMLNFRLPHPEGQNFCGVCKIQYMNFQQHTESQIHKSNCYNSPYTQHISQMCLEFTNSNFFLDFIQQKQLNQFEECNKTQHSQDTLTSLQSIENSSAFSLKVTGKQPNSLTNNQKVQSPFDLKPVKKRATLNQ